MKYTISVNETSYGFVEVEADNDEEAVEKAREAYEGGNTIWNNGDVDFNIDDRTSDGA